MGISPRVYPTQTVVASSGVYPANQASACSSFVPVFPAAGRPKAARVPVPDWTFSSRIRVTIAATPSEIARCRFGLPQPASVSSRPSARTTFLIAIGSAWTPPAANVEYADVRSSGETAIDPRPMEGT
jgi:hypothetical protein